MRSRTSITKYSIGNTTLLINLEGKSNKNCSLRKRIFTFKGGQPPTVSAEPIVILSKFMLFVNILQFARI